MNTTFEEMAEQAKAFQKMWADSFTNMMSAGLAGGSSSDPPPEAFKQMRSGVFKAMSQSWEEFLRSPEFLKTMKQSMDNAIAMRSAMNEFFNRVQHELQAVTQEDLNHIMSAIGELRQRVDEINEKLDQAMASAPPRPASTTKKKAPVAKKAAAKKATKTAKRKR